MQMDGRLTAWPQIDNSESFIMVEDMQIVSL
jgi:hypothetical protein